MSDNPSVTAAPCQLPLHKGAYTDCHGLRPRNDRKERDCRGCGALCYEHEGTWHRASCTDSSRTPRGEKRRTLLISRLDIEALEAPIVRPKWCDKEEIGNG